jgi:hypothetical protein
MRRDSLNRAIFDKTIVMKVLHGVAVLGRAETVKLA